ncbi:MAG: NAD(P)/FAD-dependent oxidoreductase, partial [Aliifodinibius sp.]|nr:NAD(P)/FAD-dependent oxidoreductase [Fodinibius sp.]NIV12505.1 NAD(P)/FAD-dependent oxidoreductase [Fodinibius sp.]NIY30443.1 NAD(P)/FAD-dependent oxidoreductase [Fodinibius sp.]
GQEVVSTEYVGGKWQTETHDTRYASDNLIIASGYTDEPFQPTFPGMDQFSGEVLHSSDYHNGVP